MSSTTERLVDRRSDAGQVLVLFAGAVLTLLIVAALAFEAGMMLVERRDAQNAADAAALAGARYVLMPDCAAPDWVCTEARAAAIRIARVNGFDDADPNESVQVHIPPTDGRYAPPMPGSYVEVEIDSTRASLFAGVIGRTSWDVGVYAVATNEQNLSFPFSMLALNRTACKAIQVGGGGVVEAYGNIQSNSNGTECGGDAIGFSRTGGSTIDVFADDATCRSAGIIQDQGSGSMTCTAAQNSFVLPDPLAGLDAPAMPGLAPSMVQISAPARDIPRYCPGAAAPYAPSETQTQPCDVGGNGASYSGHKWLLSPGLYPAGIRVTNHATAYLLPGVYWIGGGGFQTAGDASVVSVVDLAGAQAGTWGGGVLIYNSQLPTSPGDAITLGGSGATLRLKMLCTSGPAVPPDEGCLPSGDPNAYLNTMSIFQDRTVTAPIRLNGSASGAEVEGIIYAPGAIVTLNGNGGTLAVDQVIADQFNVMGDEGTIRILKRVGLDALITAAGLVD